MKLIRIRSLKMRAGQTLLSIVFLAVVGPLRAQSIHVAGKVTAAGIPVQNARITFIASDDRDRLFSTLTDGDGAFQIDIQTLVESQTSVPEEYFLAQNYPNPFSVSTAIAYFHDYPAEAWIAIYDVLGREVQRFSASAGGGVREVIWDGADRFGNQVAPGLYFYRLQVGRESRVKKLLYLPDTAPPTGTRDAHFFPFSSERLLPAISEFQQAPTFIVRIENTETTVPRILPAEFTDQPVQENFPLNYIVEELSPHAATIFLHNSQQTIRGFGAANIVGWRPDMTAAQIQTAFGTDPGQLGFTILRLRIPFNTNDFRLQVATAKAAYERGAMIIASPWSPPARMKTNNSLVGGRLIDTCYADYAEHLASFAVYMAKQGVPLYAISVQNEPDVQVTYESCDWSSQEMVRFLSENAPAIGVPVMAPESFHFDRTFSDAILRDSLATANTAIIAGHIYGGGLVPYPPARQKGKEVWMTEHLDTDIGWAKVLATGKEINDCLVAGMSAYVWWYIVRFYGPIDEDGRVTKRGYVMSQFSRFIRPGFVCVDVEENPQPQIHLSAYRGDGCIVLIAINTAAQAIKQTFIFQDGHKQVVLPYVTSQSQNCAAQREIPVRSGIFRATLPPSSITTFVAN